MNLKAKDVVAKIKPPEEVLYLRAHVKDLTGRIDRLRIELGEQRELADAIAGAITVLSPLPSLPIEKKSKAPSVFPFLKFSDWHIGEMIRSDETEGLGKYSYAIAEARLLSIVGAFLKYVRLQRAGYRIDECVISCEGDFISGDIHDELRLTNEFPMPEQAARAAHLMAHAISVIAAEFSTVRVVEVGADNHGRLTKKPQYKQKTRNSMNYVVYEIANAELKAHKNVLIERATGAKHLTEVGGHRVLIEHGDGMRGWMGIPFYGIERAHGREGRRRMRHPELAFDFWSIGHWHVPSVLGGRVLINGSLSGTSELDHLEGREAEPAQLAVFFHREHGLFNWTPFHG